MVVEKGGLAFFNYCLVGLSGSGGVRGERVGTLFGDLMGYEGQEAMGTGLVDVDRDSPGIRMGMGMVVVVGAGALS